MRYARSWTHRLLDFEPAERFGTQRCWTREGKDETETVNQTDKDGFIKLTEGEQMKIPFD